ncbi:uncharacterized protein K02A2.6-like [Dendronephthya gigantea]|uniref:uncharacterized protein K02A2.6-like n=1 Tax=Dendronephthya gigantea TaxID=151771 RepID=UPI00106C92B7|nr:uncharacterized protein K02A2.6-like [Dendronephthya gigantea]
MANYSSRYIANFATITARYFTLVTDHKPLEVIYGNRNAKASARVERWVLRLQPYSFKVIYRPGRTNPDDYLSRHPVETSFEQQRMTEEYVNFIALNSVPKTMTIEEIVKATDEDQVLKGVRAAIKLNKWDYNIVKQFKQVKDELSVTMKGVILGDQLVKDTVAKCIPCQAVGKPKPPEPLSMTSMPKGHWEVIHADFYSPLPSGEYLLVVIDWHSRYPEVEIVSSTKASTVIPKFDKMFARHGIQDTLKTDNGPPFHREEYRRYIRALGIKVLYSTPHWPQGNSEAKRFMQPLGKALRTAKAEGRPWRQELNRFLLQYRTTPHSTTKVPPSELIFNRVVKGKLPMISKRNIVERHKQA